MIAVNIKLEIGCITLLSILNNGICHCIEVVLIDWTVC